MSEIRIQDASEEDIAANRVALGAAVTKLYPAFQHRKLSPDGPDVCTDCCMPLEVKQRVATTPKKAISDADLQEFQSAAKGEGAGQDMAYFLPRTMEFIAQGKGQGAGLFSLFWTYFPPVWPTLRNDEQEAVREFYAAFAQWWLGLNEENNCDYGLSEIVEMCACGGFDTEPVFSVIADPPTTPFAVKAISDLLVTRAYLWQVERRGFFEVAPDRQEQIAKSLSSALSSPAVLSLLEAAALQDNDEELAELASMAHWMAESIVDARNKEGGGPSKV